MYLMLNQHTIGAAHHTAASSVNVAFTRRATAVCRAEDGQGTVSTTNRQVDPAILARLAKAKQYKSGVSETASAPAPPPPPPPPRTGPSTTDWGAMTSFLDSQGRNSDTGDYGSGPLASTPVTLEEQQAEEQRKARFAAASHKDDTTPSASPDQQAYASLILTAKSGQGKGSATQAAPFLQAVLNEESTSQDAVDLRTMSMEQFTEAKEQRRRQLGAEILTVDPNYRATQEGEGGSIVSTTRNAGAAKQLLGLQEHELLEELQASAPTRTNPISTDKAAAGGGQQNNDVDLYAPKVSTWGVFPRPKDMSKEYGGGRNILPGQELETPEQKAKREAAYAQALRSYRAKAGLEVDQEAEAEAEVMYNEGMSMFLKADLQGAYLKFKDVLDVVPLKSKFGGLAGLQAAIILDSQGLSDKAKELYRKLQGHAVTAVSRKSKQMLFGFEASKFLKADTISYAPKKGDFDRYFRPLVDRNTVWVPTEEERLEDERAARQASLIAVAVLIGPIAMIGALIAKF